MKTLYLSDMDGTLLGRDSRLSPKSQEILHTLIKRGELFSIATARSMHSAMPILKGLDIPIPIIMMNGAIIYDPVKARILHMDAFAPQDAALALSIVREGGFEPFLYTINEENRQRIYYLNIMNGLQRTFYDWRVSEGDTRFCQVDDFAPCLAQNSFYVTVVGPEDALRLLSERLARAGITHHLYYDVDVNGYFIECCPRGVDKGTGALRLKEMLGADRLVVFGDNHNDLALFAVADESYAVANGQEAVREAAGGVIGESHADGVALFLAERCGL